MLYYNKITLSFFFFFVISILLSKNVHGTLLFIFPFTWITIYGYRKQYHYFEWKINKEKENSNFKSKIHIRIKYSFSMNKLSFLKIVHKNETLITTILRNGFTEIQNFISYCGNFPYESSNITFSHCVLWNSIVKFST